MLEIINRQRKIEISAETFEPFAEKAVEAIPQATGRNLSVAFVSDRKMRELNRMFRHKNETTDVLSFPYEKDEFETDDNLGDIIISAEQARRQAAENELDFETEIKQLILHGILHLCGYDHEQDAGEMNRLELKLRAMLKIND